VNNLIIIGAGAFGREILSVAGERILSKELSFKGFLDDNPDSLKAVEATHPVLGGCAEYMLNKDDRFVCAIGNPKDKLRVCEGLLAKGATFMNMVHSSAFIAHDAALGVGLIAFPNTYIATQATISDFVTLNVATSVGHDVHVGRGCTLSSHCDVTGFACLEQGVFMGSHATILPGKKVGEFSIIGAGSVVIRNIKSKHTVFGIPARTIVEN